MRPDYIMLEFQNQLIRVRRGDNFVVLDTKDQLSIKVEGVTYTLSTKTSSMKMWHDLPEDPKHPHYIEYKNDLFRLNCKRQIDRAMAFLKEPMGWI